MRSTLLAEDSGGCRGGKGHDFRHGDLSRGRNEPGTELLERLWGDIRRGKDTFGVVSGCVGGP